MPWIESSLELGGFLGVPRYVSLNYKAVYISGLFKNCFIVFIKKKKKKIP